jgi:hypothetical protein
MFPEIGLMIGLYIVTRMFQILLPQATQRQNMIVMVFAGITVVVTVFVIALLFIAGVDFAASGF